ncbi:kinesin-like protein KIN-6 isoform X2 [Mercurialis annua]|uniref:kinesin-like protein KIN-6 isoform X2 n=1 Tax=Mercurialis annua TaxID=3986 RepID=UPI002160F754|nr:kinesin-like protein KIN-6 isoform X2 [Mercurialis annua]
MESNTPLPWSVTVRRNPHRRARPTPLSNPPALNFTSSKPKKQEIPPFPLQDILSIDVPQPDPSPLTLTSDSESLRVYLRIKPLLPPKTPCKDDQNIKLRQKNVWPQAKKKNNTKENSTNCTKRKQINNICISVNDSQSVTLSPPVALQESKRIKSVVYEGFSCVFPSDSSQNTVYNDMVKPLVDDFLNGKNGMIAALGPSGSGKTHTVFGTAKEPGMVPLALKRIFGVLEAGGSKFSRFSISMFEIYSEGGKAEKMFDLSPDGADLSMQQSTIKGLQEIPITDAAQAESLIASAMLKRATAMTNTNSQSSRSQCIINIHSCAKKCNRAVDVQPNNAVLTIVDLAGAERERRTGNQGSRLLESNFINNTSMVFGLCLRSLLEHQKNPKKPLQKHFQNSLLTRYLRDYFEGKKRMALILTVKPGEEDYLDTAYLLRQASPYMKIKFNIEEQSSSVHQKRQIQSLSRNVEPKRKKLCSVVPHVIEEEKSNGDQTSLLIEASRISKLDSDEIASVMSDCSNLATRERNHTIMQNFAKALWNVLKECNGKLKVAERTIESMNENLRSEKSKYLELEKRMEDLNSRCTCSQENPVKSFLEAENKVVVPVYLQENESSYSEEMKMLNELHCSPTMCNLDRDLLNQMNVGIHDVNREAFESNSNCANRDCSPLWDKDLLSQKNQNETSLPVDVGRNSHVLEASNCTTSPRGDQGVRSQMEVNGFSPYLEESKSCSTPRHDQEIPAPENQYETSLQTGVSRNSPDLKTSDCTTFPRGYQGVRSQMEVNGSSPYLEESKSCCTPRHDQKISTPENQYETSLQMVASSNTPNLEASDCTTSPKGDQGVRSQMEANSTSPCLEESKCCFTPSHDQEISTPTNVNIHSSNLEESECRSAQRCNQDISALADASVHSSGLKVSAHSSTPMQDQDTTTVVDVNVHSSAVKASKSSPRQDQDILKEANRKLVDLPQSNKDDVTSNLDEPDIKIISKASGTSSTLKKPKRRLMPVSSILLRDISALGIENEPEKPKGKKAGKKMVADERTQGSISLQRLLQSKLYR